MLSTDAFEHLEVFDNIAIVVELVLILALVIVAGQFAAPLLRGEYAILFWGGTVVLGLVVPLALNWLAMRQGKPIPRSSGIVVVASLLILLGSALLRISIVAGGMATILPISAELARNQESALS